MSLAGQPRSIAQIARHQAQSLLASLFLPGTNSNRCPTSCVCMFCFGREMLSMRQFSPCTCADRSRIETGFPRSLEVLSAFIQFFMTSSFILVIPGRLRITCVRSAIRRLTLRFKRSDSIRSSIQNLGPLVLFSIQCLSLHGTCVFNIYSFLKYLSG